MGVCFSLTLMGFSLWQGFRCFEWLVCLVDQVAGERLVTLCVYDPPTPGGVWAVYRIGVWFGLCLLGLYGGVFIWLFFCF